MPTELLGTITALSGVVEKGGVIGLLIIFCVVVCIIAYKLREELKKVYARLEKARIAYALYRQACINNNIKVEIPRDLFDEDEEPA